ncbi:MAG: biotin/lipoyl-binding protein [Chloroflexi bacterium]|nr:biotin/lipoyl-binding protein [Chloroflexota bacterium]
MDKLKVIALCLALLAAAVYPWAYGYQDVVAQGTAPIEATKPSTSEQHVLTKARVVPIRSATLSFPIEGIVAEVLVSEGDQVKAGQVLIRLDSGRQQAAVLQAKAELRRARAQLAELKAGPRPEEIAIAEAAVMNAQARLQKVLEGPSEAELTAARIDLANAEAALRTAQSNYDAISWRNDLAATAQSFALDKATKTYTAIKARLDELLRGPSEADMAIARSEVREAQANLELLRAGARPETIAVAEAEVAATEAALEQAVATLAETELRAPFTGTIAALNVSVGEYVAPGMPVAVLGDLSAWLIETRDVTEQDVVRVQPGAPVTITFDAIPDLTLTGRVSTISLVGEETADGVVYTVTIIPDLQDSRLRWNMSALVSIE